MAISFQSAGNNPFESRTPIIISNPFPPIAAQRAGLRLEVATPGRTTGPVGLRHPPPFSFYLPSIPLYCTVCEVYDACRVGVAHDGAWGFGVGSTMGDEDVQGRLIM